MKKLIKKLFPFIKKPKFLRPGKYEAELNFWKKELENYQEWYDGELKELFGEPSPDDSKKVTAYSKKDAAILTWLKIHQMAKYLDDLMLDKGAFSSKRILDVGSGPFPSATVFENCEVYCLDPLLPDYIKMGYPIHYYNRAKFVYGFSEAMPFPDHFFDAVLFVNSLDHVNDLKKTSSETRRVLKPSGMLRMHVHYHRKTDTEPLEISDKVILENFAWCQGLSKIRELNHKRGFALTTPGESYALWSS